MARPKKEVVEMENEAVVATTATEIREDVEAWIQKEKALIKRYVKDGELAEKMAREHAKNRKAYDALRKR